MHTTKDKLHKTKINYMQQKMNYKQNMELAIEQKMNYLISWTGEGHI